MASTIFSRCSLRQQGGAYVATDLIPVEECEKHLKSMLVPLHMEEKSFVPHRVSRMSNDTSPEDFLTKAYDAEGIHIPASPCHISPPGQVARALDCKNATKFSNTIWIGVQHCLSYLQQIPRLSNRLMMLL
jgi:hypothetical protein